MRANLVGWRRQPRNPTWIFLLGAVVFIGGLYVFMLGQKGPGTIAEYLNWHPADPEGLLAAREAGAVEERIADLSLIHI